MTKDVFIKNLKSIERDYDQIDNEAFYLSVCTSINILMDAIGDEYGFIDWFIWEKHWRGGTYAVNGKYITVGLMLGDDFYGSVYDAVIKVNNLKPNTIFKI